MRKLIITFILSIAFFVSLQSVFAQDITINADTIWEPGTYSYENVWITNGATLIFNGNVILNANTITIDSGSSISADSKGYPAGQGPGAGPNWYWSGSGAGYGGKGRASNCLTAGGLTYGSATTPIDLGSGGGKGRGYGGAGGGAVQLVVSDTLTVNGAISANGQDAQGSQSQSGGGSGGSVYIITKTFSGSGSIAANGGKGGPWGGCYGGGGGGGRIAIYYQTSSFTGKAEARGGTDMIGNGEDGTVGFFDTQNNDFYPGHSWRFQENDSPFGFNKVASKDSKITSEGNISLAANSLIMENSNLTISGKEILNISDISLISSIITTLPEVAINFNLQNLNIDSNSSITADAKGYSVGQGPGAGAKASIAGASGAGYGGRGGAGGTPLVDGGLTYGSATIPIDFGSGGGRGLEGVGGGAIKLTIADTLTVNGSILANGHDANQAAVVQDGGGSGGSIYIIAKTFDGAGLITANGGKSSPTGGAAAGGGGGGGRIAIYFQTTNFTGTVEAKGGIGVGNNGEDGTLLIQQPSLDAPFTFFNLIEKSATILQSNEHLSSQGINLTNEPVTGDLNGTINFTDFEIVTVTSGAFSNKGFFKGKITAALDGISYNGSWRGMVYPVPSEKKIYLKGEFSGDINGICEGYLTESVPESGVYDKYQADWKINRIGSTSASATINLQGTLSYRAPHAFTSGLYIYQANMEGIAFGSYTGPLNAVVTHLRLSSENEYKGEGFSVISYTSSLGQGEGWAYNQVAAPRSIEFQGLFKDPLLGKLSALLDENNTPKTLTGSIERMDLGAEPMADLEVVTWGPGRVSPGETVNYIIEVRNDGDINAENTTIIFSLDPLLEYVSSTYSYFNEETNEVIMDLGMLEAKGRKIIRVTATVPWGLEPHALLGNSCWVATTSKEKDLFGVDTTSWRQNIQPGDIVLEHNNIGIIPGYWKHGGGIVYGTKDDIWTGGKNGYFIVEPLPGTGVRATPIENWDYPFKKEVVVLRVEGLTQEQKDYITNFWKTEIGKDYQNWYKYPVPPSADIEDNEWYCSELIWAPYSNRGISFDSLAWYPAIAPQEIYDSDFTLPLHGGYFNYLDLNINIGKNSSMVIVGHDPNELLVSPEGDVRPGDTLNYTINYENTGEGIAFGVYITDTLDGDLDDSDSTLTVNNGGVYNVSTRTITWFIGELASNQQGSVSFSVNVNSDAQDNAEVINFATVYFPSVPETTRTNGTVNKVTTFIDNITPTTTISLTPSPNPAGWNNSDVSVALTAVDNDGGSGVAKTEYSFDNVNWTVYTTSFTITNEGPSNVYYRSCDNADNIESPKSIEINIDKTPPTLASQMSPQPNSSGWYNADTAVSFSATDNLSGITSVTEPIIVTQEGANQNIGGEAIDMAGNIATTYVTLNIDKTPPQLSILSPQENQEYFHNEAIPLNYATSDTLSGISSAEVTLDGVDITGQANIQTNVGNHLLILTAIDQAGNQTTLKRNFTVKLKANVTIIPRTFLEGQGIFVALVKFPAGYNVRTITDAVCDGAPSKKVAFLFDYATIFFKKEDITQLPLDTTFTLRGHFNNGLLFEGTDTITRVIKKVSILGFLLERLKALQDQELKPYRSMANF